MKRLQSLVSSGTGTGPSQNDQSLRRVAARLALQTVLLLLVMLVALEIIVYLVTQQTLLNSLRSTLQNRSQQADPTVCRYFHLNCGGGGPGGTSGQGQSNGSGGHGSPDGTGRAPGGGFPGPSVFRPVSGPKDVSAVYFNDSRHVVDSDGPLGGVVLSPGEVMQSLKTARAHCCTVHSYNGQSYLVYTAPLVAGGSVIGAVQTSISEREYLQTMDGLLRTLLIVALLGLVGSAGVSVTMAGRALRPIRLAMQRQRDFVADAAHELRTPLAIQRTIAEVEKPDPTIEELQSTVAQMLGENRHLTRLVEDLSLLARADTDAVSIEKSPVDLSSLLATTAEEIGFLAAENGIVLDADVQDGVSVLGDVVRLRQLVLILLDNAMKHTPTGGEVRVRLSMEGGRTVLNVIDSGRGIASADLPRVFDRFYRADEARAGEGTGLGLAIARWIVDAHGGQIAASNATPHGAVFTVTLPASRIPTPV